MATNKRNVSEIYAHESHEDNSTSKNPKTGLHDDVPGIAKYKLPYPSTSFRTHDARPVTFQQPTPLITFSYNSSHVLQFDDSALRYYVSPPVDANLKYRYDHWIRRPEEKVRIDGLLKAWMKARRKLPDGSLKGGIISWRGVMTKILTAPYEERDGWELNVMCVDGILYFEEHISDEKLREKEDMTPHHRMQTYYGYSFESFCTSSKSDSVSQGGWGGDVDNNVQWCSVVKTKLGDTKLLIGGEVDCVRGKLTNDNNTLVELKTSLTIRGPQDEARFEKKLLKFYFQSFLLGVPTMQIPRMVRDKPDAWDPSICLDWGQRFLTFLKNVVYGDTLTTPRVWRAKFTPKVGVNLYVLNDEEVNEVTAGEEDRVNGFLPNWYWDEIQKDVTMGGQVISGDHRDETAVVLPPGWII